MADEKKSEREIDKDLEDTFPASDPTPGNVFVGAPDTKKLSEKELKGKTERFSPDDAK